MKHLVTSAFLWQLQEEIGCQDLRATDRFDEGVLFIADGKAATISHEDLVAHCDSEDAFIFIADKLRP